MKTRKVLKYTEVIFLIGIILTPILYFSITYAIGMGPTKIDLKEGDTIRLKITDFSFQYTLDEFENYTVTPGIYLCPVMFLKEDTDYNVWAEDFKYNEFILFEGNSTSDLTFNFHVDSISKKKTVANLTLDSNNRVFSIGSFGIYSDRSSPFF